MTKKEKMLQYFRLHVNEENPYFFIRIQTKGVSSQEVVVNYKDSLEFKLEQFDRMYNDHLGHRFSTDLGIVAYGVCASKHSVEDLNGLHLVFQEW